MRRTRVRAREPRTGYIALGGFLPANVPVEGPIARFSNVVVRPGHVPFDFAAVLPAAATPPAATADGQLWPPCTGALIGPCAR